MAGDLARSLGGGRVAAGGTEKKLNRSFFILRKYKQINFHSTKRYPDHFAFRVAARIKLQPVFDRHVRLPALERFLEGFDLRARFAVGYRLAGEWLLAFSRFAGSIQRG